MGYKLAGYDVIGNVEIDPAMMKLYRENNHTKYSYLMDVRDFEKIPDEDLPEPLKHLDILDGSPPCSVFSMAGKREEGWNVEKKFREGQAEQRLDDLFLEFIKIVKKLKPRAVIAENVKGLILQNAKGWVNQIVSAFDEAGYNVQVFLLNAARMGVPQKRERVFFVCGRKDQGFPKLKLQFDEKPIPFGDVRSEHGKPPKSDTLSSRLMKYRIETDRDLCDISKRVRKKTAGYTAEINSDESPAYTITSAGYMFRMCDGLEMTDEDIIRCQTFPADYNFLDQDVKYVCGMSVPPVMMAKISEQVDRQWMRRELYV